MPVRRAAAPDAPGLHVTMDAGLAKMGWVDDAPTFRPFDAPFSKPASDTESDDSDAALRQWDEEQRAAAAERNRSEAEYPWTGRRAVSQIGAWEDLSDSWLAPWLGLDGST